MQFIDQASGERANFGTYLLTITLVLSALVVGQLVAESIAVEYMGFSFLNIPKNVDRNNLLILLILPISQISQLLNQMLLQLELEQLQEMTKERK